MIVAAQNFGQHTVAQIFAPNFGQHRVTQMLPQEFCEKKIVGRRPAIFFENITAALLFDRERKFPPTLGVILKSMLS